MSTTTPATTAPATTGPGAALVPDHTDHLWSDLFDEVRHAVAYKPGYQLHLKPDTPENGSRWYFQVEAPCIDVVTGQPRRGFGGKAYLSPHACRSELVQTALGLFLAYEEHEAREHFRYRGRQVYGPHFNVEALWDIADQTEVRK